MNDANILELAAGQTRIAARFDLDRHKEEVHEVTWWDEVSAEIALAATKKETQDLTDLFLPDAEEIKALLGSIMTLIDTLRRRSLGAARVLVEGSSSR